MIPMNILYRITACAGISLALLSGADAKPGNGKGGGEGKGKDKSEAHGKGQGNGKKDHGGKPDKADKAFKPDKAAKKEWNNESRKAARFRDDDRVIVTRYFDGYRGEPYGLPPGLAKKIARGKPLPPGWQKKLAPGYVIERDWWDDFQPVEPEWFPGLPIIPGTGLYWYGDRIVRVYEPTREIIDVIPVPTIHPDW